MAPNTPIKSNETISDEIFSIKISSYSGTGDKIDIIHKPPVIKEDSKPKQKVKWWERFEKKNKNKKR